jgi:proteasome lid subunit RPN8/RPN11
MSVLRLTSAVFHAIRTHGERTYPHECCGALLGNRREDRWHVEDSIEAGNTRTDSAHNRYQISPLELIKIERAARQRGLEIAGFYHSHPDHPAQWSTTDFEEAHWIGCSYVITAIDKGKAAQTNSFALVGTSEETKSFEPEAIEVTE